MATAEQVLSLWKTLVPREREAVFLAIARGATFPPAVRELAASSLMTMSYQNLKVGDRFRFADSAQECVRVKGGYVHAVPGQPPRLARVREFGDGLAPVVFLG